MIWALILGSARGLRPWAVLAWVTPSLLIACQTGLQSDTASPPDCADPIWMYPDADGDGFGDQDLPYAVCEPAGNLVPEGGDCDDDDDAVHPGAVEACNGADEDCTGAADDDWDADGDGQAGCAGDCDNDDPENRAGVDERCDGQDNDCDGEIDEGFDEDLDGFLVCHGDCDDTDPGVHPGIAEVCDGVDNDCNPLTSDGGDLDGDGFDACDGDCNDADAAAFPGGVEVCDGHDNDCSGGVDDLGECWGCTQVSGYWLCPTATSFDVAEDVCDGFAGGLVVIDDANENTIVGNLVANYMGGAPWISATDRVSEGTWATTSGTALPFVSWGAGEPNDSGGEDCAGTNYAGVGLWNDFPCTYPLPFVCQ